MLRLGRYSNWPRSDIREMTPEEFAGYLRSAAEMARKEHGA
jgi:hypothetical protein